jgi:hypothetical protein
MDIWRGRPRPRIRGEAMVRTGLSIQQQHHETVHIASMQYCLKQKSDPMEK